MKKTIFALATLSLLLAACSSSATPELVEISIEMSDFAFSPDALELQVGQVVTINLTNVGALEHELMIGREIVFVDGLPEAYMVDYFDGVEPVVEFDEHSDEMDMEHDDSGEDHHEESEVEDHQDEAEEHEGHHGFMVDLEPGQRASITFTVTESMLGEWEIGCLYGEGSFHYTSGMVGSLTVTN